ncbi:hypothetical protein OG585_53460 (plasmid) [Streptomyces sp. NBC_01340]|uniref:hypothetical protein n=1 Tax=Streptomyces sp. NBC_01340 TaxID=2903830 RepID=UPI002E0E3803|nr:hypothetical protein OG585_53460 [Streptomyces sp. NBC_01340]
MNSYLVDVAVSDHRLHLHEYGIWRLLPRIRQPRDSRPQTYPTLQYAKSRIKAAESFLAWLAQRDTPLAKATQADVEEFITQNPQLLGAMEPFLRWTTRTRKTRKLSCRKQRIDQPMLAITSEERCQLLRRLLHDGSLDLADRVMGAIILTYAAPLTKTLMIRTDDIRITDNDDDVDVHLRLGATELRLPPLLDQLVVQHLRQDRLPHVGAAIVTGPWLFPGMKAGQPLSHARAGVRLRRLGLRPGPARSRALLHLAARIEAPLLAQALGITPRTAVRWSDLAGRTYSGYVARVVRTTPDRQKTEVSSSARSPRPC